MDAARAAALLGEARLAARPVPELAERDRPGDLSEAYAVQAALHQILGASDALSGWKIGATTRSMQRYLGVGGPAFGRMLSSNTHRSGAALDSVGFVNPGIECEIAVRIGRDADDSLYDRDAASGLVDRALPAVEIVENRYGDFLARGAPTLVADDFFHKACVLGSGTARKIDLAAVAGRVLIDGMERGRGVGADVMGHPLEAVAWLANALRAQGQTLREGEIVLTGSVTPVVWLDRFPCAAEVHLDGLGEVSLRLE